MILVLSGTADGRAVIKELVKKGYKVLATAATSYGGQLLSQSGAKEIIARPLDQKALVEVIAQKGIKVIIDITHPYAEAVSQLAFSTCLENALPYIRYERPEFLLPEHPLIIHSDNYLEAAEKSVLLGETIFLTTGSKTLDVFTESALKKGRRVVARVLPHPQIIKRCIDQGLTPRDIIAMQGPFTKELNIAMLRQFQASVLVTKNSGTVGGLDTKIAAAMELKIPIVIVNRPKPLPSMTVSTVNDLFRELEKMHI
ncbi:precorrin-6A reductase [Desulfolucanica intricata]|uniref:precorrin-6A reductase n=1 Tax=Desulfolucanica intricata TaxID=1285191 RepID=UPI000836D9BD|nr:precorrin-6A reductase [Desulfolucanica intricata]